MHQQQGRALLARSEALPAFYIDGRLRSNMTLICDVTLNFICTSPFRTRQGRCEPVTVTHSHRHGGSLLLPPAAKASRRTRTTSP